MTAPLHDTSADADKTAAVDVAAAEVKKSVEGRSLRQIAWTRLKRDKLALAGGIVVIFLVLVAIFAPWIVSLLGHPPNEFHQDQIDPLFGTPKGSFGGISSDFLLGLEPQNGRDVFSRIVYGARISLLVAFLAALVAVLLGTIFGMERFLVPRVKLPFGVSLVCVLRTEA